MPFARVGAMPQTATHNDGKSSGAGPSKGRERGITMEDLKKQTAIRLATEQHLNQALPAGPPTKTAAVASDPRTKHPVVTPQTLAARRLASASSTGYNAKPNNVNCEAAAPVHYQRLHHHHGGVNPLAVHQMQPNTGEAVPAMAPPPYTHVSGGHTVASSHYYDQPPQAGKNRNNRNGRQANKPSSLALAVQQGPQAAPTRTGGRYRSNEQSGYLRSASAPTLPVNPPPSASSTAGYNTASSNQGGQSSSTSKLPHGLTVHELKEMTKARLQAEAAEKISPGPPPPAAETEARDASGFENVQPSYNGQPMHHHTSQEFDRMSQGSDAHLVSTQAPTKPLTYDQGTQMGQPGQVSPLPPAFQTYTAASSSSFDGNSSNDQRTVPVGNRNRLDSFPDNWESASVTSHNSTVASDYLGSESAFSSGVGGFSQLDEPPGMSLGRTQSYPIGNSRPTDMASRETTPTSIPSPLGATYFESSNSLGQGSRQRAMTLSPRPGLSLLHEDRPGFSDEDLGIPNFSSSRHARQQLTARSRRSFSPVLQHQTFVEPMSAFGSNAPGVIGGSHRPRTSSAEIGGSLLDNRPRTSSAVSLPAISHTAEEFDFDLSGRKSSDCASARGGAHIREHPTSSSIGGTDSFLSSSTSLPSSSLYGSGDSHSIAARSSSSVFRNDYGGIPAPPGLGGPPRAGSMDSGLGAGSNRVRAATWVAGSMSGSDMSGSDMFGSGNSLYDCSGEDTTLAGDLASILKLSGAEENKSDNTGRSSMFNDYSGLF